MEPQQSYPAKRAVNVVLGMTIVAAVVFGIAGVAQLRQGSSLGLVMIGLGLSPLIAALLIRRSLTRPTK
jgi:hypothetical protein